MIFRVFRTKDDLIRASSVMHNSITEVVEENNTHAYRLKVSKDKKTYGVEEHGGEPIPLVDFMGEAELMEICFVIVDCLSRRVYYTGRRKDAIELIKVMFQLKHLSVEDEVSLNDLKELTKLKIVNNEEGNLSLFVQNEYAIENDIKELTNVKSVQSTERIVKFTPTGFDKIKMDKFIRDNNSGLRRVYIEGRDEKGNLLSSDEDGKFSRKYEILKDVKSWEEKSQVSLIKILEELSELLEQRQK